MMHDHDEPATPEAADDRAAWMPDLYDTATRWDHRSATCLARAAQAERATDPTLAAFHARAAATWATLAQAIRDAAEVVTSPLPEPPTADRS